MHKMDSKMKSAMESASKCHKKCLETISHCLEMGGEHTEKSHMTTLMDCAEICMVAEHSMMRESPTHMSISVACAVVCDACAESCERIEDKEMEECAKACQKCAEDCRAV